MKSTTTTLFLIALLIINITYCSRSFLSKRHILKPDLLLIQERADPVESDNGKQYFISDVYPVIKRLYDILSNDTVTDEFRDDLGNLALTTKKDSLFCNKDFLKNQMKKVFGSYDKALNETKVHNFTDDFSPALIAMREKYVLKKDALHKINKQNFDDSEEFEIVKKTYVAQAQILIEVLDDAISRLSYISKYKLLELKNDLETEFAKFKSEVLPKLGENVTVSLNITFSRFMSFCVPDLLNNDCDNEIKKLAENGLLNEDYLQPINDVYQLRDFQDVNLFNEEKYVFILKTAKKQLELTRDLVQKRELVGLFIGLADDFEREADQMRKYLDEFSPFQITDFIQPAAANNTTVNLDDSDEKIKPDFTIYTFKEHFLNLLDSTAHICSVIKHDPFLLNSVIATKNPIVKSQNEEKPKKLFSKGPAVQGGKQAVSDDKINGLFEAYSDYQLSFRQKFLLPIEFKSVDEFLTRSGLYCPYNVQTEVIMKANCYADRLEHTNEKRWDNDIKPQTMSQNKPNIQKGDENEEQSDATFTSGKKTETDGLYYITNNEEEIIPENKPAEVIAENKDTKGSSETPAEKENKPENKPENKENGAERNVPEGKGAEGNGPDGKATEEKPKKEELIPTAPLKSEEFIVNVNPANINGDANTAQSSSSPSTISEQPNRDIVEPKPDLKILPVVIPDDEKDSAKSPDSSKGSNETI